MKGEEGVWGALANGMKRSQIKYSLLIEPCYLFSRKSRNMYFYKPNQIIKWPGLKRT